MGNCTECSAPVKRMEGVFCANFCEPQGSWPACQNVWHANCYACLGQGKFPVKKMEDKEGNQCTSMRGGYIKSTMEFKGLTRQLLFNASIVG
jgi:hypothetical protein